MAKKKMFSTRIEPWLLDEIDNFVGSKTSAFEHLLKVGLLFYNIEDCVENNISNLNKKIEKLENVVASQKDEISKLSKNLIVVDKKNKARAEQANAKIENLEFKIDELNKTLKQYLQATQQKKGLFG